MRAGELRHRIEIQENTTTTLDDAGHARPEAWNTVATVWGAVVPKEGQEFFRALQTQPNMTDMLKIRYYPGLTSAMRMLFHGRALNIQSVVNVEERNIEMHVLCKEDV